LLFADRVAVLSQFTRDRLLDAGVPGVVLVPPAVDVLAPRAASDLATLRERLAPGASRPVVVFPGDYEFSRASFVLADAIPLVLRHVDATFVYACRIKRPPSRDIEARVRAQLAREVDTGRVVFVGETREIRALLAAADLVVLPSESTYAKMDLPLVLLEAMAEGTPVVVADVAPLNEVLGTKPTRSTAPVGCAVPPLDAQALAATICELLAHSDTLSAMGRAGRAWVGREFTAERMGAAYAGVYSELLR
jgi:phosphatidylinositol alpha-1,6-mannosyltransferase